jgi:VWFA-related protein
MSLVTAALLASSASRAQAPAQTAPSTASATPAQPAGQSDIPLLRADTHAVVVDVVVTHGQDEPVEKLSKKDFLLVEDGKPQAIDFFEEHSAPATPTALVPLPAMPPHVYTNVPAAPKGDSVNVLLLDSLNTPRQDQSYVHQQIVDFLKTMKPDARIAIFLLGSKLTLIQGFTDDPALLRAALDDKKTGFSPTAADVSRTRQDDQDDKDVIAARQRNLGAAGRTNEGLAALGRAQAELKFMQDDQRVSITLDALQKLGRFLAGVPGRKNLIWFSSTYPIYFFPHSDEKQPFNSTQREFTNEIKATADILTLSKVAVYPISAEGLVNDHPMEADNTLEQAGRGGSLMANISSGANDRAATMSAMEQLASDTGGEAFFNTNSLGAALNHAIHNGEHYYTLVYTPTNKDQNGQFRRIQIKLDAQSPVAHKAKLSYRRGYYADDANGASGASGAKAISGTMLTPRITPETHLDPDAEADPLQRLLGRGLPSSTEILFGMRVLPSPAQPAANARRAGGNGSLTGPVTRYTADFMIDWRQIKLETATDGNHTGKIRVALVAYDHDGKPLNWVGSFMKMNINPTTFAAIQRSGVPAHLEIDVPSSEQVYLAAGVYDFSTRKAGTMEVELDRPGSPTIAALPGGGAGVK